MPRDDDQLKPRAPLLRGAAAWLPAARFTDVNRVRATVALPVLLAALALVLRLYGLSDKPLWYDEIVTLNRANLPLAELVIDALKQKHYPTYFLLLGPFASADIDGWMLRFPSALFGAVCVLLVSRLAAEMRGPRTGLGAGLLMALSPFEVQFGQEARSYTLTSCLVLVAIWGLVRIANRPEAAALPVSRPEALRGAWVTYTLGTIGALFVQNIAIPWLLVSNLAMLAIVHHAACERRGLLRNWALAQVVILLLWIPALIAMWLANRGAVRSVEVENRSGHAGGDRPRLSGDADCDFGHVRIPANVGATVPDVEHRSFFRAGRHWGRRTAGEIFPADRRGRWSRGHGKPCALLQLRNQAALGPSRRVSRGQCTSAGYHHYAKPSSQVRPRFICRAI